MDSSATTEGFSHIETNDVHQHAESLAEWDQRYEQLSAGGFRGSVEHLELGDVQVFRERTGPPVIQRGYPRRGTVAFAVTLAGASEGRFCGERIVPGSSFGLLDGREFELITPRDLDVLAVSVDRTFLLQQAVRLNPGRKPVLSLPPQGLGETSPATLAMRDLLLAALATARQCQQLVEPVKRALRMALCGAVLAIVDSPMPESDEIPSSRKRFEIVRDARGFIARHPDAAINVPDLCERLNVSRRTLQYCFEDVLDMSPMTYLRVHRLNGVRHDLQHGAAGTTVADVAAHWGVWHLSRFAAEYRRFFGELPSQTLRRAQA